jgi:hypothetical protein
MKRIIDGVTYNTDTSTVLARSEYETAYNHQDRHCEGTLYQTRGGAFFVAEEIDLGRKDEDGNRIVSNRFVALSRERAEKWIMAGDVEVCHNPFGEPPEAEAEPCATIYLRVPSSLKKRIDQAATTSSMSINAWALRCLERSLGVGAFLKARGGGEHGISVL